jgi:fibronectin-binding autotransporter adhesin
MRREGLGRAVRWLVAVAATAAFAAACGLPVYGVALAAAAPVNTSPPSIAGVTKDGGKLKASAGTWSGQRLITYAYQWTRCDDFGNGCEDIASARSRVYKVVSKDVGHAIRVLVTAADATGSSTETSAPTDAINAVAPKRKGAAKITGLLKDGQTLTVATGTWKGTPPFSYGYQWEGCDATAANCSYIPGAKGPSYQIVSSQIGGKLRALITATGPGGSATVTSRPTTLIGPGPPVNSGPPTISGSLQEGQTLTADPGTWAGTAPFVFGYQWKRCSVLGAGCEEIPGATSSTYTLGPLDVASKLVVVVTASNAQGSASVTSAETSAIGALLPSNTVLPAIIGLLKEGQLLSVVTGSWSGTEPITYSYQWQLCNQLGEACKEISGATGSTLKLLTGYLGGTLDVVVKATNVAGSTSVTTPVTGLIEGLLPVNNVLPTITGLLKEGGLLSVGTGSWSGTEPRCPIAISGSCAMRLGTRAATSPKRRGRA